MKRKALALISGGLDSLLAAKIILAQGVEVEGVNFFTGFTGDTPSAVRAQIPAKLVSVACAQSVEQLGIKLHVVDILEKFKPVLLAPKYGYGANFNPCLDCKLFMINCAKAMMQELGFDFLISGEVLGQRPMSQRKDTLPLGAKDSGGLLLRPLCAQLLEETEVERLGWVKREQLYAISGRGRKAQLELARNLGLAHYPQPAGGCVLTEGNYCARFKALTAFCDGKNCAANCYSLHEIMLARLGRHLRIAPNLTLIVGRDESDNLALDFYQNIYPGMKAEDYPGATVLLIWRGDDCGKNCDKNNTELLKLAARVAARFSQGKDSTEVKIKLQTPNGEAEFFVVAPLAKSEICDEWYVV